MISEQLVFKEHTLYYRDPGEEPNVVITNTRAEFECRTFAIEDIASVSMAEIRPNKVIALLGWEIMVMGPLIGVMLALAVPSVAFYSLATMVTLVFIGVGLWVRNIHKPRFAVKIATSESDVSNVLISTDRKYIVNIVRAVNKAREEIV